jgi:hypothetical protein
MVVENDFVIIMGDGNMICSNGRKISVENWASYNV